MVEITDIIKKRFSRSFFGYDIREVDLLLDEVIERMEAYEKERLELMTAMDILLKELDQFDEVKAAAERARANVPDMEVRDRNTESAAPQEILDLQEKDPSCGAEVPAVQDTKEE